jgi:hypothetical protein
MAKKKPAEVAKGRPGTVKHFLRVLYTKDKDIANDKVLEMVLAKFPLSKANAKTVLSWRKELREEGIDIPKQRAGAKPKGFRDNVIPPEKATKSGTGKKKTKKKVSKKKKK